MGAQALRPCSVCSQHGRPADDVIETNAALQRTDEQYGSFSSKLPPLQHLQPCHCNGSWEALHDDIIVNLLSPAWCDDCGAMLVGVLQQSRRCRVCKRLACENCASNNPCFAGSLLSFVLGGSKEVPAGIRVLCMDMALLHGLAADHPEVIAYSAEELWRNPAFLRGLVQLADGCESKSFRKAVEAQVLTCKKPERELAVEVISALLQEDVLPDSVLAFAIELLESLAECNPRAFASLKESLKHGRPAVRAAAVTAAAHLVHTIGAKCSSVLSARLRDNDVSVRCAAASILPMLELEERAKLGAWMCCLQDSNPSVRKAACKALSQVGLQVDVKSRPVMTNILLDKDPGVQAEAWSSLRAFQTCGTAKIMVALARSNRLDDGTRKRLVKTMRSLLIPATPDEISVVASSLIGASWWLRLAMVDSFHEHLNASDPEVRGICVLAVDSLADRADNKAALAIAAKLGDVEVKVAEAAWTAIQKRLEDEDPDVNRVWLEAVNCSHLHPSVRGEVVSAVLRNLIDHNWLIQMAATRALRLNQPAESQEVLNALKTFKKDLDPAVRQVAEEVLQELAQLGRESADSLDMETDAMCKALSSGSF